MEKKSKLTLTGLFPARHNHHHRTLGNRYYLIPPLCHIGRQIKRFNGSVRINKVRWVVLLVALGITTISNQKTRFQPMKQPMKQFSPPIGFKTIPNKSHSCACQHQGSKGMLVFCNLRKGTNNGLTFVSYTRRVFLGNSHDLSISSFIPRVS